MATRTPFAALIGSKKKTGENVDLLLNGVGDLVIRDVEKAEECHAFFTLVFTSKTCVQEFQVPETSGTVWSKEGLL